MNPLRLRYQTIEFESADIHLCTLRDNQQFSDPDGTALALGISSAAWPIFGVLWPSSMVLAHHMNHYNVGSKRILEVGCGMALSSLLLNHKHADITATDHHPAVQTFLERNVLLNDGSPISFERTDWLDSNDQLGLFDLIIGSDLLYEDQHIALLASFIERHAKPSCEVILVDPGRGRKNKLSKLMIEFGFHYTFQKPVNTDYLTKEFKGHILHFER